MKRLKRIGSIAKWCGMNVKILNKVNHPINEYHNGKQQPMYQVRDASMLEFPSFASAFWVWDDELKF